MLEWNNLWTSWHVVRESHLFGGNIMRGRIPRQAAGNKVSHPGAPLSECLRCNMTAVQKDGTIKATWGVLGQWKREYTIETVLDQLRRDMATAQNRKLAQPPEGTKYT
eukprot:GEMP01098118.1.p1 GENE.GEMP01098118.1~~GEMP01098118.1.p1  ORF type:complete len:108 (+),score=16.74 GEMP01098118.1:242-565(+)